MDGAARFLDLTRRGLRALDGGDAGVVVAVSGGADSVALLRALLAVRAAGTPLTVAHLNHRLRGDESDADEAFVVRLHGALAAPDVALQTARLDVTAQVRAEGGNVEAAARRAR